MMGYNTTSSGNFLPGGGLAHGGRDLPASAMTLTPPTDPGHLLPSMGDYISEDFLQILEVSSSFLTVTIF